MWIENNNNSIQNSNIGGYTNEDSKHGERKREKEGSAREIARLPTEIEGGVGGQNVRAVTSIVRIV